MEYKEITNKEYGKLKDKSGNYKVLSATGATRWVQDKKLHRIDGPAVVFSNGVKAWFINGNVRLKEEWFEQLTKEQLAKALANPENF